MSEPTPSSRTVGRWLKAERLRPWRYHNWQHIHDPEQFLKRARPVLQLYMQAISLLKQGIWLVCMDEKTSIQAREGEEPPRPAEEERPQLQESRYHRRGACHLFAGLSVGDGKVYGTCRERKCFADFQTVVQQEIIPEALRRKIHTMKLILDNGTTHAPKQLELWLQQLPVAQEGTLTFEVLWLPTNASWLDQMEIWFSILQRQCLQPNHFGSLPELEQAMTDFMTYYNQEAKPIKWTYTIEKLEKKLEQRIKQQEEQNSEQNTKQNIKTKQKQEKKQNIKTKQKQKQNIKTKQEKEQHAKNKIRQKIGLKLANNLRERKHQDGEIRAD